MKRTMHGFGLPDAMLTIAILALVLTQGIPYWRQQMERAKADTTAVEMRSLLEAQLNYYDATGSWSPDVNTLITGGYLPGGSDTNPWGNAYTFEIINGGNNLQLSTTVASGGLANHVSGQSLPFSTVAGSTVTTTISRPGTEATHDPLLHRDAVAGRPELNRMNTSIDMNNNDVNNARTVRTQGLTATTATLGTVTLTDDLWIPWMGRWLSEAVFYEVMATNYQVINKPTCRRGVPTITSAVAIASHNWQAEALGALGVYTPSISPTQWQVIVYIYDKYGYIYPSGAYGRAKISIKCQM